MKLTFHRNSILPTTLKLTRADIEQQALTDSRKYARLYQEQSGSQMSYPIDVDHMAQVLWGVSLSYEEIPLIDNEEVLGYYDREGKRIVVDPQRCKNEGRTTFTVAHELGHLSLHNFLMTFPRQLSKKKRESEHARLEWQADRYAASILAPQQQIVEVLRSLGLIEFSSVLPVDLTIHGQKLQERFGLSRQALEIRLEEMEISTLNKKYE